MGSFVYPCNVKNAFKKLCLAQMVNYREVIVFVKFVI